jgi:predicted lysophospholipase L1 biosynthesis ABC-type transport system permease subunit
MAGKIDDGKNTQAHVWCECSKNSWHEPFKNRFLKGHQRLDSIFCAQFAIFLTSATMAVDGYLKRMYNHRFPHVLTPSSDHHHRHFSHSHHFHLSLFLTLLVLILIVNLSLIQKMACK